MLPSTGLFKSISCPYYHGGASNTSEVSCYRPYCHFKHVKKDEREPKAAQSEPVPEYTPAPKLLKLANPVITLATKKKSKLEYRPDKPELNRTSSRRHSSNATESVAPVYVPSSSASLETSVSGEYCDKVDKLTEKKETYKTEGYNKQNGMPNEGSIESSCNQNIELHIKKEGTSLDETIHIKQEPIDTVDKIHIKEEPLDDIKEKQKKLNNSHNKDGHKEERRDSTASISSRHKHKSSSSSSKERSSSREQKSCKETVVRKEKDKDSERSKDKGRERDKDKKSSSSSSSSRSKHSSSNSSKSEKHRSSSSSKHKSSSTSKSHQSSNEKSSSSSQSTHKTKDRESSSSRSSHVQNSPPEEDMELDSETVELFATTEEDIMKECEMIYDQLEQEFASLHQSDAKIPNEKDDSKLKRKASTEDEQCGVAATQRKRVAYENADKFKSTTNVVAHKPNHIRNAMQAIYHRQTVLRKKQEEDATAAQTALREAEEKVREANEALRKVKEKNLTPLIPKSFLTPPTKILSRTIAPVANILALERAKKKVEELKAEKKLSFTPAQTSKGVGRVAHKATTIASSLEPEKQKPPVLESTSTKISFNIRMQYYEMMVKHCMAIYPNAPDAWERAQTEELTVFKKCNTPVIYKSSALLAINKLRKEAADSGNKPATCSKLVSHEVILAGKLAQNTSWSVQKKLKTDSTVGGEPFDKLPAEKAYDMVYDLRLTEEQLISNGYPRPGTRAGTAVITNSKPMRRPNDTERYCTRCGKVFNMSIYDEVCVDECNYHPKSTGYRRGFADNLHRCCQQPAGTAGCTYANYHVSDYFDVDNLTGYVSTIDKDESYMPTKKDIYALDCEMCYTTHGIELTRVTVVDINARTVYDALVKPDNKIVDYNTIYSGITEQMLANETRTLRDVQAILMSMFHSKTVLVGHSLESDLKALKLIHSVVVDTSVLFPHKMGPPKKRALKTLCIENLKRIIQENEAGHDSAEDAEVCIQLIKFYLRNKIS